LTLACMTSQNYLTDPSGILQLGARYYWPEVGRFVSQDPIGDGVNWYAYVGDNPLVASDPSGMVSSLYGRDPNLTCKLDVALAFAGHIAAPTLATEAYCAAACGVAALAAGVGYAVCFVSCTGVVTVGTILHIGQHLGCLRDELAQCDALYPDDFIDRFTDPNDVWP